MKLTHEQQQITACNLSGSQIMKIMAFAGTGKTTTLVEYARKRPGTRFLYIAFNRSVSQSASEKFPPNVTCRTAHSLAWPKYGSKHQERMVGSYKANTVKEVLELASYEQAKFTIDTLLSYLSSADKRVGIMHVPAMQKYEPFDYVESANRLGRLMCTGEDPRIGMLHDGYLKLFQLSNPVLHHDVILLDEAQDVSPVITDIFIKQQRPRILAGDTHQQIYSFRGARDAIQQIESHKTFYLTRSFRFNKTIAHAANLVLSNFKGEKRKIKGTPRTKDSGFSSYTLISRTNATLFAQAAKLHRKHKLAFVGGVSGYRFQQLTDASMLKEGKHDQISSPFIRSFSDFKEMKKFARASEDLEILSICNTVKEYGGRIPGLVKQIMDSAVDEAKAQVTLTTAHKAKGLEWDHVHLAPDFIDLVKKNSLISPMDVETDEFNLIYVAITRARHRLRFDKESPFTDFFKICRKKRQ